MARCVVIAMDQEHGGERQFAMLRDSEFIERNPPSLKATARQEPLMTVRMSIRSVPRDPKPVRIRF